MTTVDTRLPNIRVRVVVVGEDRALYGAITGPNDIPNAVRHLTFESDTEALFAIPCDIQNQPLGIECIGLGGVDSCPGDIRRALRSAIVLGASGLILAHNHPSGSLKPSDSDIELTQRLYKTCRLVGLDLLDHVIVTIHGEHSIRMSSPDIWA